jgi:hypothetical protein
MKKIVLLSVVASSMIMAGGDIQAVEPVVEPVEVEASMWDFSGQAVLYTQTVDVQGNEDMFGDQSTYAAAGLQLGATASDLGAGFGAGVEVSAIEESQDSQSSPKGGNAGIDSAAITQAYLTYTMGQTSLKVGRQQLPKALSPFAFTEGWQMFKNTFEAALVVNSSIPNTTLVYAAVTRANNSVGDLNSFNYINGGEDGHGMVHMVTAQNKSINNVTLTGTYYYAPDMTIGVDGGGDASIIWGDATYKGDAFTVAVQGGQVSPDGLAETTAMGAKIAGKIGIVGLSAAYSSVDDGAVNVANLAGSGVKTPLYTQSVLNQNTIKRDSDAVKVAASVDALGGKVTAYYINADLGDTALASTFGAGVDGAGTYNEAAVMYKAKVSENTTLFAAYVNQVDDRQVDDTQNFVRFWARYNFN